MKIHPHTSIGQVHLTVADLDRSVAFYTDTLGFRILLRDEGSAGLTANGEEPLVTLTEEAGAQPQPAGTTGLYHFAILAPTRAALGRSLQHLLETGYPLSGASDHHVSEALYLDDPDGNGIEIYRDRPRVEWPARDGVVQMGNAQLDTPGILADAEQEGLTWA
ncbi:MAG: VOC family protein, partial [Chloroflexota bacterium]|nr:VOC family protein [Chloroflexota bacterium]